MITIFHNPRCSKSRETLALVEEFAARRHLPVEVVEYLKTPPTVPQLKSLLQQLGCDVREIVRSNEEEYDTLGLAQADDEALLSAIAATPKLLQRPIVVYRGRAVIGRPPERVRDLFDAE
ncbi:arsenate reductase (glutaredoxin) [Noviherbaspirillum sp.]|jgi:arsenate reductase|uniref:arsenate reductase (glutaredoxin) n=1 Tax=Noviherbaspirillum sp. TaxID=1926288 RepID=UPI0025DD874F|nr:arsenate reductase (glutaredoxin) [Noviherbaspirillum sp.]